MQTCTDLASHGHFSKVGIAEQLGLLLLEGQHLFNDGGVILLPTGGPGDVGSVHLLAQCPAATHLWKMPLKQ